MSAKTNGVKWSKDSKTKERRKAALKRLQAQLADGMKPCKETGYKAMKVALTDRDRERIQKEIATLEGRI